MIPLWVKNRGEQISDSATFRWLAQDAGSGAVDLTLLKGTGSATFTRAGATATTVLSTGLISSTIAANTARSYYDPAPTGGTGSYMFLPGVSGAYASTPSTASLSDTGNKWVTGLVALADYTPSSTQTLCGKFQAVNGWLIQLITTGRLRMYDGTSNIDSTASVPTSDGADLYWGVEHITNNGSNQRETKFYTSSDGVTYTQLGTTVLTATAAALVQNGEFSVGAYTLGTGLPATGRFKRVQIYNGTQTSNTLVADFDPTRTTQASTSFAASTGETWTINGRGFIYAAPAYLGYLAEESRVNLVLRSEDFSLAWAAVGTPTRSAAAKTCGALNMDLIGDDSAAALEGYTQTITYTADATKTVSLFIAQGTSTSTVIRVRDTTATADRLLAAITWSGGLPVITMTTGTSQGYTTFPGSIFRIQLLTTSVTAANTNSLQVYPATDAALSVANTGDVYIGGVQSENGTFATSYIPTAAATSTRAADNLIFPISGNVSDTVGTCSAKLFTFWSTNPASAFALAIEDANGRALYVGAGAAPTTISMYDGTNITNAGSLTSMQTAQRQRYSRWSGVVAGAGGDQSITAGTFDGNMGGGGTTNFGIGANSGSAGNEFSGCIQDVRIWQRFLSDSEVFAL